MKKLLTIAVLFALPVIGNAQERTPVRNAIDAATQAVSLATDAAQIPLNIATGNPIGAVSDLLSFVQSLSNIALPESELPELPTSYGPAPTVTNSPTTYMPFATFAPNNSTGLTIGNLPYGGMQLHFGNSGGN